MDPNACLDEMLRVSERILGRHDECDDDGNLTQEQLVQDSHDAGRLAELVQALDVWMLKGGFAPRQWKDIG